MPRDSAGNFSLVPGTLVNTGDNILVSQHNPPFQDVASALTGSLARNGTGGMQAALNMNSFGISSVADGSAPGDAVNKGQLDAAIAAIGVPLGAVIDFWGTAVPDGFAFCYGQEVSRTTYAALFAVIGTNAGSGDGTTTFNLPDYRALASVGKSDMGGTASNRLSNFTASTLGAIFGSQSHALAVGELPSHNHGGLTAVAGAHTHSVNFFLGSPSGGTPGAAIETGTLGAGVSTTAAGDHQHGITAEGGGAGHNNVQPTIVCNKIMRLV